MKILFQAFIGSIIIHFIYFVGMMLVGYIKTKYYEPDIASAWDKVETLQNEVAFGKVISPYFCLLSIVGATVICGIIIFSYKKYSINRRYPRTRITFIFHVRAI